MRQPPQPPTPARTIWLMAQMRLRRLKNQTTNNLFRAWQRKQLADSKVRIASASKTRNLWLLTTIMALLMSFAFINIAHQTVMNLQCQLVASSGCQGTAGAPHERHADFGTAAEELAAAPFAAPVMHGLTMELSLLFLIAVVMPLASKELAQPDWDLEWLVTLPVQRRTLLWGRLLERSASNVVGLFALLPLLLTVAWASGYRWSALPIAILGTAALLPLAALLHTLADTGLRMWLAASQLRNLQALATLVSMPVTYFVMALGTPGASTLPMDWARNWPAWTVWTPPGVLLQMMQAHSVAQLLPLAALLLAQSAALLLGGVWLMQHQLRHGVVGASARESARRPLVHDASGAPSSTLHAAMVRLLSPIKRRELRLLSRDRNFLVQTLLLPVIIIGSQMLFNGQLDSLKDLGTHHTVLAAIAFGIGAYVLMLSAFQTLNNEGQVLWLLYTFPRSVESVLKEKAQLWGVQALIYPLAVFGLGLHYTAHPDWQLALLAAIVIAGIPIFSVIAVALGVFACDPQAVEVRNRVRPTYIYLYMLLSSFYIYSVYTSVWSQKLVIMVLSGALALALWQKARDQLPYLLDPAASPPPRVSTSDGLIAATMFFVLQALGMLMLDALEVPAQMLVTLSFSAAGLLVYLLARLVYWRSKTRDVPRMLRGASVATALRWGVGLGLLAIVPGIAYLVALQHSDLWAPIAHQQQAFAAQGYRPWVFLLAVGAAPLCEEFIFRGLIFGGLRRSMNARPAMLVSAAIFAIIHPELSMLPVFGLGILTAAAYERSKLLLAPMLVHALYNAAVLGWQYWG
ncbi:MAG: lysostaphin resistance A-like protein [Sphingomonadaceae bacterium]